jgi:multisubunit Na+/H+ antiporter MnhC subunit
VISKTSARFLIVAGVFNVVIWPRFAKAVVDDDRAWAGEQWNSTPQAFFWVHAVLITTAIVIGLGVLAVGVRAHRSASKA